MTELDDYRKFKRQVTTLSETFTRISNATLNGTWNLGPYCNAHFACPSQLEKHRGVGRGRSKWLKPVQFCILQGACNHRTFNRKEAVVNNGEK